MQLIAENGDAVAARTGLRLEVTRVAVHDPAKPRDVDLPAGAFTGDAAAVVADPDVDLVVEVIGGVEPAKTLVLAALKSGKPVVTANKELLADCGAELFEAAAKAGRRPAVRGGGGRGHPDHAAPAGVAGGGPDPAGPRHRATARPTSSSPA